MIFLGKVGLNLWSCSQWEMSSWNTSQAAWATALFPNWTNKQEEEPINDAKELAPVILSRINIEKNLDLKHVFFCYSV